MARWGGYALTTADGARAIAERIRRRDVTATEVVTDHLGRLDEARRTIGGVAWSDDERVLVEAGAADAVVAAGRRPRSVARCPGDGQGLDRR